MISSLSQLTMTQFIELLCGDDSALSPGNATKNEIEEVKSRIIFDFTKLSDPPEAARIINRRARSVKNKGRITLFRICHNLMQMHAYDEVRGILAQYGIRSTAMTEDALMAEIESQIRGAERDLAVEEEDAERTPPSADEIRQSYDRQCATLMTYFKFQIDLNTIKASQFACMIDQATKEIKAKQAALAKKR